MPDATEFEWLVQFTDIDKRTAFERFATVDEAIPFLHKILGTGQRPRLYRETPITLKIDVGGEAPVKAPRKRRKTPPPADKPGSASPTGPGNGEAGESKEGAATAHATGDASGPHRDGAAGSASNPASPVSPWTCEARFDGDPACPGFVERDPVTGGAFCGLHIQIPESHRRELHRKHASRNRPVRVAHAG